MKKKIKMLNAELAKELALKCLLDPMLNAELAKELALKCLVDPYAPDVEKKKRLAGEHVIRAETFKSATRLIGE